MTKLIGRGAFTRAYLMANGRVLLKTRDPIKECMAWGWFPDHPIFPKLEYVDLGVYEMDYYPKVSSLKGALDPDQYAIYKELRALVPPSVTNDNLLHTEWHKVFDTINNPEIRDLLKEALDGCGNYGADIGFEISPRNVAVSGGKLVLLDCFFSISKLKEVRK